MENSELISKFLVSKSTNKEDQELYNSLNSDDKLLEKFSVVKNVWEKKENEHTGNDFVEEDFLKHMKTIKKKKQFSIKHIVQYAAVALLLISVGYITSLINFNNDNSFHQIAVNRGDKSEMTLSDGTKVIIAPASKLMFNKSFGSEKRVIRLEGEAFFEVSHNKYIPFIVNTNGMNVKVLGTKFNVKSYNEDNKISTTLLEGSVDVNMFNQKDKFNKSLILKPLQKVSYFKNNNNVVVEKYNPNTDISWTKNKLSFRNEKLKNIIKELNRIYDTDIRLDYYKIGEHRYSAEFDKETVVQILESFKLITPFKFEKEDSTIVIKPLKDMPMNKN